LVAYSALLLVLICFFFFSKQKRIDLGLKNPPLWRRYVLIGLVFAVFIVLYWAGLGVLMFPTVPRQIFPYGIFSVPESALFALLVSLVEETAFRGYILRNLRKVYNDNKAIAYSSFLFGLYPLSFVYILLCSASPSEAFIFWSSFALFTLMSGLFLSYLCVNTEQTVVGTISNHSSNIFIASFVPYTLANPTIGYLLSTSAFIIFFPLLILLKRKGWLTSYRKSL
jgi:membrane protease YdiL (CAAX protease family)